MMLHGYVKWLGLPALSLLAVLLLVSCTAVTPPVQTLVNTPVFTATSEDAVNTKTPTPKIPTPTKIHPTQSPSLSPTSTPTATQTQIPPTPITWENTPVVEALDSIAPQNVNRVVPLAQWGKGNIQDVAYSPDGKILGIASSLGVYLYDSLTLEQRTFYPTQFSVTAIQFSPDGTTFAWGFANGNIEIRQVATGEVLQALAVDQNRVKKIAYAEDGYQLTAIQHDLQDYESGGMIYVWDLKKSEVLSTREIFSRDTFDLSTNGQALVIEAESSQPLPIALIDVISWKLGNGFSFEDYLYSITISPDGKQFAAVGFDLISLFNSDEPDQAVKITDFPNYMNIFYAYSCQIEADGPGWGPVRSAAYSPDGELLILGLRMNVIQIRRTSDGALLASFSGRASRLLFAPDGQTFTLLPGDGAIEIRRARDGSLLQRTSGLTNFRSVAFSSDQRLLAAGASDDFVRVWRIDNGQRAMNLQTQANRIAFSPDSSSLATGSEYGGLVSWNLGTGEPHILSQDQSKNYTIYSVNSLLFTPDGQTMLVGTQDCMLEARDTRSGNLHWKVANGVNQESWLSNDPVESIAFFPDHKKVAVNNYKSIEFFDLESGKWINSILLEDTLDVIRISFIDEGNQVVVSGWGTYQVWDIQSSTMEYEVIGPSFNLVTSPDGQIIGTTNRQGTIYLWLAENGQQLAVLPGHRGEVTELTFSADGKYLASSSEDGTIRLWGVR